VVSQLCADYKRTLNDRVKLPFRDYLKMIGFAGKFEGSDVHAPFSRSPRVPRVVIPRFPVTGTLRIIVLLVDFDDNIGERPAQQFEDMLFSRDAYLSGSMREFFSEVSNGKVDVVGSVHGWMRMPQPYSYYVNGKSGLGRYPHNAKRLAEDALGAAHAQGVEFSAELDKFGNELITGLLIVHAGLGAEVLPDVAQQRRHIWSHKSGLRDLVKVSPSLSAATYLTVPEDANMGVCAHELGHLAFQWDDFYDPDNEVHGQWAGAGHWDLMAAGSWGNGGNTPSHPAALHKAQHNWVPVQHVTETTHLVLPPYGEANAVIARIQGAGFTQSQALLLENRRARGFDVYLPGSGLLVWRVDTDLEMGDASEAAMMLIQADGKHDLDHDVRQWGDPGDPFPGSENCQELLDTGNISTSFPGQGPSGIRLKNIRQDLQTGVIELDVEIA
jgi:immune inhibitor A